MVKLFFSLPLRSIRILSVTSILLGSTARACCSPSLKRLLSAIILIPRRSISEGTSKVQDTSEEASVSKVNSFGLSFSTKLFIISSVAGLKNSSLTLPVSVLSERLDTLAEISVMSP